MPEPINWGALAPQSGAVGGGSRHMTQAPPAALVTWKCPKCAVENQGPLEQGCTACGAGKPGHRVADQQQTVVKTSIDVAYEAFTRWLTQVYPSGLEPNIAVVALTAFKAGIDYAMHVAAPVVMPGTAEQRTLAAALSWFIEQVLANDPEEIASGEWLNVAEARRLLERMHPNG